MAAADVPRRARPRRRGAGRHLRCVRPRLVRPGDPRGPARAGRHSSRSPAAGARQRPSAPRRFDACAPLARAGERAQQWRQRRASRLYDRSASARSLGRSRLGRASVRPLEWSRKPEVPAARGHDAARANDGSGIGPGRPGRLRGVPPGEGRRADASRRQRPRAGHRPGHALRARVLRPPPGERPPLDRRRVPTFATCPIPTCCSPPLDRSFKKPGGYVMRDKLEAARQARPRTNAERRREPERPPWRPTRASRRARRARPRRPRRRCRAASTRDALAELLLSMADDEFVQGFLDSEWTGIAPMLEEDVAFSSLAQDEIGHARALLRAAQPADRRGSRRAGFRPPGRRLPALPPARPPANRLGVQRRASLPVRHGRPRSGSARWRTARWPLAELVAKVRREENYHLMHLDAWIRRLSRWRRGARRRSAGWLSTALAGRALGVRAARGRDDCSSSRRPGGTVLDAGGPAVGARCDHALATRHRDAGRGLHETRRTADRRLVAGVRLALERVHQCDGTTPRRSGERAARAARPLETVVRARPRRSRRPRDPGVSIVDLGIVHDVRVEATPNAFASSCCPPSSAAPHWT